MNKMSLSPGGMPPATPYPATGAVSDCVPAELEPIFHSMLGAVSRIDVQRDDLTKSLTRAIGSWPVEASNGNELAPSRDGLIPAMAAACDLLHAAIDRMQDPVNRARTL